MTNETEALTTTEDSPLAFLEEPKVAAAIERALPKHVQYVRICQIIQSALKENPALAACERRSILSSVIRCCQTGLEPNTPLGQAYLIPFKNGQLSRQQDRDVYECHLLFGYQGLIDLAYRSGQIASIEARLVSVDDEFHVEYGTNSFIKHIPKPNWIPRPDEIQAAYAVVKTKNGGVMSEVVWGEALNGMYEDGIRKNPRGPWRDSFEGMAKKAPIRRVSKLLPRSVEQSMNQFYEALAFDQMAERGEKVPSVTIEGVKDETLDAPFVEGAIPQTTVPRELGSDAIPLKLVVSKTEDGKMDIYGDHGSLIAIQSTLMAKNKKKPGLNVKQFKNEGLFSRCYADDTALNRATLKTACEAAAVELVFSDEIQLPENRHTIRIRYDKGKAYLTGATNLVKSKLDGEFKAVWQKKSASWVLDQKKTPEFIELCESHGIEVLEEKK